LAQTEAVFHITTRTEIDWWSLTKSLRLSILADGRFNCSKTRFSCARSGLSPNQPRKKIRLYVMP